MARFLAVLLVLFAANQGAAQDLELPDLHLESPCAPSVAGSRRGVTEVEGAPVIWFQHEVAACLLTRLRVLPLYVARVTLLEQRLVLSRERDALRAHQVELADQEAQEAKEALEAALRRARELDEASHRLLRRPVFWFSTGVVV